jgi:hypothetical protein
MSAFKHSAVSFGAPDMPPPDVGGSIGPISLHNAIEAITGALSLWMAQRSPTPVTAGATEEVPQEFRPSRMRHSPLVLPSPPRPPSSRASRATPAITPAGGEVPIESVVRQPPETVCGSYGWSSRGLGPRGPGYPGLLPRARGGARRKVGRCTTHQSVHQ